MLVSYASVLAIFCFSIPLAPCSPASLGNYFPERFLSGNGSTKMLLENKLY